MAIDRRTIQSAVAPAVESALSTLDGLDMSNEEHKRRFMRALVHIGSRELLLRGTSIQHIAAYIAEALKHEHDEFQSIVSAAGALNSMILPEKMAQA